LKNTVNIRRKKTQQKIEIPLLPFVPLIVVCEIM